MSGRKKPSLMVVNVYNFWHVTSSLLRVYGYNEPTATSAPVQDEAVQAKDEPKTYSFPLPRDFSAFFSASKFSHPTYLPHLISRSLHLQSLGELLSLSSTKFQGDVRHKA
jgi:hypothetical protein